MNGSLIQWCDDTVNPIMGCDGCELWNANNRTCYAGKLTDMREGRNGWPDSFDIPKMFPGRMAHMAKSPDLSGRERGEKPWLNGTPRLIFVSDMGDALSNAIHFAYLKKEIVDVVAGVDGQRHIWLWLTKRPNRMAVFDQWLQDEGIEWPDNLVAMTTVTSQVTTSRIDPLRKMRAKLRGLSVEPLWEAVTLDLTDIDWCIVGGESGARATASPFDLVWAQSIRDQCNHFGTSFFLKQLGSNVRNGGQPQKYPDPHGGSWNQWPHDLRIRELPKAFMSLGQEGGDYV